MTIIHEKTWPVIGHGMIESWQLRHKASDKLQLATAGVPGKLSYDVLRTVLD